MALGGGRRVVDRDVGIGAEAERPDLGQVAARGVEDVDEALARGDHVDVAGRLAERELVRLGAERALGRVATGELADEEMTLRAERARRRPWARDDEHAHARKGRPCAAHPTVALAGGDVRSTRETYR